MRLRWMKKELSPRKPQIMHSLLKNYSYLDRRDYRPKKIWRYRAFLYDKNSPPRIPTGRYFPAFNNRDVVCKVSEVASYIKPNRVLVDDKNARKFFYSLYMKKTQKRFVKMPTSYYDNFSNSSGQFSTLYENTNYKSIFTKSDYLKERFRSWRFQKIKKRLRRQFRKDTNLLFTVKDQQAERRYYLKKFSNRGLNYFFFRDWWTFWALINRKKSKAQFFRNFSKVNWNFLNKNNTFFNRFYKRFFTEKKLRKRHFLFSKLWTERKFFFPRRISRPPGKAGKIQILETKHNSADNFLIDWKAKFVSAVQLPFYQMENEWNNSRGNIKNFVKFVAPGFKNAKRRIKKNFFLSQLLNKVVGNDFYKNSNCSYLGLKNIQLNHEGFLIHRLLSNKSVRHDQSLFWKSLKAEKGYQRSQFSLRNLTAIKFLSPRHLIKNIFGFFNSWKKKNIVKKKLNSSVTASKAKLSRKIFFYWYFSASKNNYRAQLSNAQFQVLFWDTSYTAGKRYTGRMARNSLAIEAIIYKLFNKFIFYAKRNNLNLENVRHVIFLNGPTFKFKKHLRKVFSRKKRNLSMTQIAKSDQIYIKSPQAIFSAAKIPFNGCFKKAKRRRKNRGRNRWKKKSKSLY